MKIIIGLGNPGPEYTHTRHNLGFAAVEALASHTGAANNWHEFSTQSLVCQTKFGRENIMLLKPQTFMNESGQSVKEVMLFYKNHQFTPHDLWVIHDDVDLEFLTAKHDVSASSAGHKGVQSIIDTLGTNDFYRLRLGLGRPPSQISTDVYVLQPLSATEQAAMQAAWPQLFDHMLSKLQQNFDQPATYRLTK